MKTVRLPPFYYFGSRTLRYKIPYIKGNDVKLLQNLLNLLPDNIVKNKVNPDGIFNLATKNAVKEFQSYFHIPNTGKVGEQTYFYLGHSVGKYVCNEPVFSSRLIKLNQRGTDVITLHNRLAAFKKSLLNRPASNKYDEHLHIAVANFQENFPELKADGIVGPKTFDYIIMWAPIGGRILKIGRHGLDTYFLQLALKKLGYFSKDPDGFFDSYTDKKVRLFQKDAQIKEDGIVGSHTLLALGTCQAYPDINYFYQVQKNDTVSSIASLFNKQAEELIKLNNIKAPSYKIYEGQLLLIPPPLTFHLVEKGENFSIIARKYAISEADLKKANKFLPTTSLLPDDIVVLPRIQTPLDGKIAYLEKTTSPKIKCLSLLNYKNHTLSPLENDVSNTLLYNLHDKTLAYFTGQGQKLNKFNIETGIHKSYILSKPVISGSWNSNNILLLQGFNEVFIEDNKNISSLPFKTKIARWFETSSIIFANNSYLKTYNLLSMIEKEILSTKPNKIVDIKLSYTLDKALLILNSLPGNSTISVLADLNTKQIKEVGRENEFAAWSHLSQILLMNMKKYYGYYYPWYYKELIRYNANGDLIQKELLGKGIELKENLFSPDDKFIAFVMFSPNTYFPIKSKFRDIFVKQLNSRLITRLTYGETAYNPVWL